MRGSTRGRARGAAGGRSVWGLGAGRQKWEPGRESKKGDGPKKKGAACGRGRKNFSASRILPGAGA